MWKTREYFCHFIEGQKTLKTGNKIFKYYSQASGTSVKIATIFYLMRKYRKWTSYCNLFKKLPENKNIGKGDLYLYTKRHKARKWPL